MAKEKGSERMWTKDNRIMLHPYVKLCIMIAYDICIIDRQGLSGDNGLVDWPMPTYLSLASSYFVQLLAFSTSKVDNFSM